jgi:hypothetical protein
MLGPDYKAGCPSCSAIADGFNGSAVHLANHDVTLTAVSRASLEKVQAYKRRMGWSFPWASSFGSDFNYDFGVGITEEQQRSGGPVGRIYRGSSCPERRTLRLRNAVDHRRNRSSACGCGGTRDLPHPLRLPLMAMLDRKACGRAPRAPGPGDDQRPFLSRCGRAFVTRGWERRPPRALALARRVTRRCHPAGSRRGRARTRAGVR